MSTKTDTDDNNRKRKIGEDNTKERKKIRVIPKSSSLFVPNVSLEDECEPVDGQDHDGKKENKITALEKRVKEYSETNKSERNPYAIVLFAISEYEKRGGPEGIVVDENDYQVVKEIEKHRLEFKKRLEDADHPEEDLKSSTKFLTSYFCKKINNADRRITSLNLPKIGRPLPNILLQLDALEELSLKCSEIVNVPRWFPSWLGDLTNLTTLRIELQEGQGVPEEISDLTNLKSLRVSGPCHVSFSRSIGNLRSLEKLDIELHHRDDSKDDEDSVNTPRHVSFPSSICNLLNLKEMTICVDDLPDEIGKIPNLETLEVGLLIRSLPTSICDLKSLKNLKLKETYIESLPEEIGDLTSLETLDLHGSSIESLPSSIGNLSNLKELDLADSNIKSLPSAVGNLKNLEKLDLCGSNIKSLPSAFGNLENLERLDLSGTDIKSLPSFVGNFENLKVLGLCCSKIESLPSTVGNLKNLKELYLSAAYTFIELPSSVGNLKNLKELRLRHSKIKSLPGSIGNLKNLKILDLSYASGLETLSDEIGNLTNLTCLNLEDSTHLIDELASTMANLKNLRVLRLSEDFLRNDSSDQILSKLPRDCQRLGCFGYQQSAENEPKCHDIIRSLACNRAKNRLGSQRRGQNLSHPPSLWPIILEKAKLAFGKEEINSKFGECWCCADKNPEFITAPDNSQSDAIFQLLVYYGETFLQARTAASDAIPTR